MSVRLEEMLAQLKEMPAQHRTRIEQEALAATAALPWVPNPGPQSAAYYSLADEVYYGGEAGGGKLLALDTPLPTPTGWATMGEVAVGDALIDEHGEPCRVVAKSAVTFEPTYRMTFSDGSAIVAGARHQWVTSTLRERLRLWACSPERRALRRAARPLRGLGRRPDLSERNSRAARDQRLPTRGARTSAEIAATLRLGGMINHSVDLCGPLRLPDAPLLVDPYVLGAWLGDGTSATGAINAADEPILAEVASAGYAVRAQAGPYAHGVLGLKRQLRTLGVIGNKHIPVPYLRGSVEQRLALLQGLMDTDGYCDQRGQCEITLCRRQLVEGVEELLYSLGVKACLRESRATLNGRDVGPRWRLKFLTALAAFRLPRKLIRQKRHGFRGTHARRYIVAAEQIEPVPMQCVQVDSPSRMYLCGRQMVPTHNSDLLVGLAINRHTRATIFREFKDDARELGRRMCAILGGTAGWNDQQARFHGRGKEIIFDGLPNEEDKQHHKGKARDFHGFDEISDYTESQYEFIIAWNRSANPLQRCRVVVTGNPPTRAKGLWVIKRWAAWLDPRHPHPAKDGELRWYLRTEDGQEEEVEGRGPFAVDGRETYAKSRTFIRARLADNPDLARSDYDATLARLPKELQDAYRKGRFDVALQDHAFQVIPTGWILEAQKRWTPEEPKLRKPRADPEKINTPATTRPARPYAATLVLSFKRGSPFFSLMKH